MPLPKKKTKLMKKKPKVDPLYIYFLTILYFYIILFVLISIILNKSVTSSKMEIVRNERDLMSEEDSFFLDFPNNLFINK